MAEAGDRSAGTSPAGTPSFAAPAADTAPASAAGLLQVELAWVAEDGRVQRLPMRLPADATLGDALAALGQPQLRQALTAGRLVAAVFGELRPATEPLVDGDRIELLEGLRIDPKEARHRRVAAQRARRGRGSV